ncbi:MAG: hypothetical protein KGY80_09140 [Candidatus Thorarchaeota archaeon]|nr:hypothetical protein [Candidatus Thorarchaeota archaeon]
MSSDSNRGIGTLSETTLHAQLKELYAESEGEMEVPVDGFIADVVKDGSIIEIQTGNFSKIRDKLRSLIRSHTVMLVYPVAAEKWIIKEGDTFGDKLKKRKSPKHGGVEELFYELVSMPRLINSSNFSIEVVLTEEEDIRAKSEDASWRRRGWKTVDRKLLKVIDRARFRQSADFLAFLPPSLDTPFTNKELAAATGYARRLAQKITYCLRKMGVLRVPKKRGRAYLHEIPAAYSSNR